MLSAVLAVALSTTVWAQQPGNFGPPPTGTGLILGRVVDAATGAGIGGVVVTLGPGALASGGIPGPGATPPRNAYTDSQGRFVFRQLPESQYGIITRMGGSGFSPSGFLVSGSGHLIAPYLAGGYGQRRPNGGLQVLDLADRQQIPDVVIKLWKGGAVEGTVYDDSGEPAVGVTVSAVRRDGNRRLTTGPTTATDDRGMYHLGTLVPGDYVIVVPQTQVVMPSSLVDGLSTDPREVAGFSAQLSGNGAPAPRTTGLRLDRSTLVTTAALGVYAMNTQLPPTARVMQRFVYDSTFYPSVASAQDARVVPIASGETRTGLDVRLRAVPGATLSGVVTDEAGPVAHFGVRLMPVDRGDGASVLDVAYGAADADGQFEFPLVPAGQYVLFGQKAVPSDRFGPGPGQPSATPPTRTSEMPGAWTRYPVTVAGPNVGGLMLTLRPGLKVSGRLEFRGANSPTPEVMRQLMVTAFRAEPLVRAPTQPVRAVIDPSGQFTISGLAPGPFVLRPLDGQGWRLDSVTSGGVDITDRVITMDSADLTGIVVNYTDQGVAVRGTVQDGANLDPNAMVFVFSPDQRRWPMAGVQTRSFASARVRKNGDFMFGNLVPGEYLIAAAADDDAGAWPNPAFLTRLATFATKLTIGSGEQPTLTLKTGAVR